MTVGILVSSYDLFNVGDLDLIAQARSMCDRLVIGVMDDGAVAAATGWAPVVPLVGRMALMSHVRGVDDVIVPDSTASRWGLPSDHLVITSRSAEALQAGDVVLVTGRHSGSMLINQLLSSQPRLADAGVA